MNENIQLRGTLRERFFRNGILVHEEVAKNLILNSAGSLLASLLATGNSAHVVTLVGFGTGAVAPAPGDTALTNATVRPVVSADLSVAGEVTFTYQLEPDQGNGKTLTERALMATNNTLFSRIVRPAIEKTEDLAIQGEWTITFTGA
jgi:hypothetical protein